VEALQLGAKWGNLGLFFLELQFALGFTSELLVICPMSAAALKRRTALGLLSLHFWLILGDYLLFRGGILDHSELLSRQQS